MDCLRKENIHQNVIHIDFFVFPEVFKEPGICGRVTLAPVVTLAFVRRLWGIIGKGVG